MVPEDSENGALYGDPDCQGVSPNQTDVPAVFDEHAYLTANPDVAAAVESRAVFGPSSL